MSVRTHLDPHTAAMLGGLVNVAGPLSGAEDVRLQQLVDGNDPKGRHGGLGRVLGWVARRENGWSPCVRDRHTHATPEEASACWRRAVG